MKKTYEQVAALFIQTGGNRATFNNGKHFMMLSEKQATWLLNAPAKKNAAGQTLNGVYDERGKLIGEFFVLPVRSGVALEWSLYTEMHAEDARRAEIGNRSAFKH